MAKVELSQTIRWPPPPTPLRLASFHHEHGHYLPNRDLEQLLRGFNAAYNDRRHRVLDGKTPNQVTAGRVRARRRLARAKPEGRAGPDDVAKARLIAEAAKEISQLGS